MENTDVRTEQEKFAGKWNLIVEREKNAILKHPGKPVNGKGMG